MCRARERTGMWARPFCPLHRPRPHALGQEHNFLSTWRRCVALGHVLNENRHWCRHWNVKCWMVDQGTGLARSNEAHAFHVGSFSVRNNRRHAAPLFLAAPANTEQSTLSQVICEPASKPIPTSLTQHISFGLILRKRRPF